MNSSRTTPGPIQALTPAARATGLLALLLLRR